MRRFVFCRRAALNPISRRRYYNKREDRRVFYEFPANRIPIIRCLHAGLLLTRLQYAALLYFTIRRKQLIIIIINEEIIVAF